VFALIGWLIFYFFFDLSEENPEVLGTRRSEIENSRKGGSQAAQEDQKALA
jgi:hypothetical protein